MLMLMLKGKRQWMRMRTERSAFGCIYNLCHITAYSLRSRDTTAFPLPASIHTSIDIDNGFSIFCLGKINLAQRQTSVYFRR